MSAIDEENSGSGQPINTDNFNKPDEAISTEDNVATSEDHRNLGGKLVGKIR